MHTVAIIPARMGSTRFPGKPMAKIHGMPMIGHVYKRACLSDAIDTAYVATCDGEIFDYVTSIGGRAVMTADTHERCSDRTAEALLAIEQEVGRAVDIVVMIQGDEPMTTPDMIAAAVAPMRDDPSLLVVNLLGTIDNEAEFEDPNEVKVVVDRTMNALYFSREPIPSRRKFSGAVPMHKQVCVIPFRRDYLITFNSLEPTPLEKIESVDMMRVLEHGGRVRMVPSPDRVKSVDTPADLAEVEGLMAGDRHMARYL